MLGALPLPALAPPVAITADRSIGWYSRARRLATSGVDMPRSALAELRRWPSGEALWDRK
jgi:hypothetical protein